MTWSPLVSEIDEKSGGDQPASGTKKTDRTTWMVLIGFGLALALLIALNMN